MRAYVDCEFNGYRGALISMAIVCEDGSEWYESVGCADPDPWVAEHVIPVIGKAPVSMADMQQGLQRFFSRFDAIHIVADWPEDIAHFCETLITGPGLRINTPSLTMQVRRDLNGDASAIPHNALEDARAIRAMAMGRAVSPELLETRVARLATVAEAARALLAALPLCSRCNEARATLEPYDAPGGYCAPCAVLAGVDDRSEQLPHAAPAEALERALDAAVAAALAGEP